tara:strand:- start:167 stop:1150 length:984 start_codon:yes stop_codon:yes gene_type:complete
MFLTQFYPNRITISYRKAYTFGHTVDKLLSHSYNKESLKNLGKKKTSLNLSKTSIRNIRDSILTMYSLSKPRTIQISNKKFIYNYRQSFITLTLPSLQKHTDVEIKKCLDRFLTDMRRIYKINNYVWKAELQKNQNIHFHLVIDKYINYNSMLFYWNKSINILGYVDNYSAKMSRLSLNEYALLRKLDIKDCVYSYKKGVKNDWKQPNSIDVRSVFNSKNVAQYIGNYIAKDNDKDVDLNRVAIFGRIWSRSTSLSSLKYKNKISYDEIKEYINELISYGTNVKQCVYDYCTVIYVNVDTLNSKLKKQFNTMLYGNAKLYNYPFNIE